MGPRPHFGLSSEQAELLLALENAHTLAQMAKAFGRDASVISRQLQKLKEDAPVVEKIGAKWVLTELGRKINQWTRDAIVEQNNILQSNIHLRLASGAEFAKRVLIPQIHKIFPDLGRLNISFVAAGENIERALLEDRADLAFAAGKPQDPLIRFKRVNWESYKIVAAPSFVKRHNIQTFKDLASLEHLRYKGNSMAILRNLTSDQLNIKMTFNDMALTRQAALQGLGWTLLPSYAIEQEVTRGELMSFAGHEVKDIKFGLWWPRGRRSLSPWAQLFVSWLEKINI